MSDMRCAAAAWGRRSLPAVRQGVVVFAIGAGVLGMARGQDETAVHPMPDLVVRPGRTAALELSGESVALDVSVVEFPAVDLRRLQLATAGQALRRAPAVHTETRGRKYKELHSFRGQIYPYPDMAFDGMWQRAAREVPTVYPAVAIDRIEIIRSSSTLFQGLADVVGVINLVPRHPSMDPDTEPVRLLGIEGGSFGTGRSHALSEWRGQTGAGLAGAQFYRTDGRPGRNAAEELAAVFGSYRLVPNEDTRIDIGLHVLHGFRELEMPDPDGPAMNSLKNRRERYDPLTYADVRLRGVHRGSERSATEWTMFLSERRARYRQKVIDPERPPMRDVVADEDDREVGVQAIQALDVTPSNTVRLGLFAHRWTAPNGKQSYVGERQDVASYAIALVDEQRLGAWTLDAGFRLAQSYLAAYSGPAFDVQGTSTRAESVRNTWEDPVLSGTLGAAVALDERHRLSAHVGVGSRRPGPGEVRPDGRRPDAERRVTADGGWSVAVGPRGDGILRVGGFLVLRQRAVTRMRETGTDARGQEFHFSENRDLRQYGVEVEGESPRFWRERLSLSAGATWMASEAKQDDGAYAAHREVPSVNVFAGLRADLGNADAGLYARHVGPYENFRFAQDRENHPLGDYVDVTLVAGVRVGARRNARVYGAIDNLLDQRYRTVVGWSDPGIRYRAGAEVVF